MRYSVLFIVSIFLLVAGCAKHKAKKQAEEDEEIILSYISSHNLSAVATGSGLYYVIETEGTGVQPTSSSTVRVNYTGYFTNDEMFDQSPVGGIELSLQNVIEGWREGIPYFKEGGTGKLLIPSALAYGPDGNSVIPPDAVLIFDIELIEVL